MTPPFASFVVQSAHAEVWVGYEVDGKQYIDKRVLYGSAADKMIRLREYWESLSPRWWRAVNHLLFCQGVAVAIGYLVCFITSSSFP
jgi:hypothetical protein